MDCSDFFKNRRVLLTGSCGTIGQELLRQLLDDYGAAEVIGVDNNESELFFLEQKFRHHSNSGFFLADSRDKEKLSRLMRGMDIVFHTAAFKHVTFCERSPFEAVQTNILGVQNIIEAAQANNVERVLFTSSDKAVNPTNVMGTSKLMGERLMTAANSQQNREARSIFTSTRFGNVLGSRGSVIPIFREQIRKGGPVTLTDLEMSRFIMSIRQAVELVIDSAALSQGGEVFVTKMPVIRIRDLAEVMINELAGRYGNSPDNIPVEIIGSKPGEKLYEELMTPEETRRAVELRDYFAVKPAFSSLYKDIDYAYPHTVSHEVSKPYNSAGEPALSQDELRDFLYENELMEGESLAGFQPDQKF